MRNLKGISLVIFSAVLFGITPILGKLTYAEGSNAVTLLFFRAALALPVLLLYLCAYKIPLGMTAWESVSVLLSSLCAYGTTLLLYSSYYYLSVGMSTTLHFIYPVMTILCARLLFGERLNGMKLSAATACLAGICISVEMDSSSSIMGVVLAVLSGCTYAFYIILLDHTQLKNMHYMKLAFYQCLISALCAAAIYGVRGELRLGLSVKGYVLSLLVALLVSVFAIPAFQVGVKFTGGTTAALLSTFEPITSILCGLLILGEQFTAGKLAGCALVLTGIVLSSARSTSDQKEEIKETR